MLFLLFYVPYMLYSWRRPQLENRGRRCKLNKHWQGCGFGLWPWYAKYITGSIL